MTAVFVHGVPETPAVWAPLVGALDRDDTAALQLPGFGCPLPDGFEPTMYRYADWLAAELAAFDEVDLVVHDWGAILALRVLADRPANVRSWVSDMGDLGDDFRWHGTARTFQTPGEGEAAVDAMVSAGPDDKAALLVAVGVPEAHAAETARHLDRTMGLSILALYRSAVDVGTAWGPGIDAIDAPGLLIESGRDPFRSPARVRRLAERTGADLVELPEAGHFWMLEDPPGVARVLAGFWGRLG
ncbi:MAG TPA: alpha/beta hydrolase [Acidimicrobiales bacterium]|nr:alpha/beta hydrolase [Acidimicrobiales bacterium]